MVAPDELATFMVSPPKISALSKMILVPDSAVTVTVLPAVAANSKIACIGSLTKSFEKL